MSWRDRSDKSENPPKAKVDTKATTDAASKVLMATNTYLDIMDNVSANILSAVEGFESSAIDTTKIPELADLKRRVSFTIELADKMRAGLANAPTTFDGSRGSELSCRTAAEVIIRTFSEANPFKIHMNNLNDGAALVMNRLKRLSEADPTYESTDVGNAMLGFSEALHTQVNIQHKALRALLSTTSGIRDSLPSASEGKGA